MSIKDFAQSACPKMDPRAARLNDAPAIARVHVEGWRTTYRGIVADEVLDGLSIENHTSKWIKILGDADHQTFVVEDVGGDIMGFADCGPERRGNLGFAGELYAIYLLDDYRGRGIGTTLFRKSAAALLESGMDGMMVWSMKAITPIGDSTKFWGAATSTLTPWNSVVRILRSMHTAGKASMPY